MSSKTIAILSGISQYGALAYFSERLARAFADLGARCRVFDLNDDDELKAHAAACKDGVDLTIAFNAMKYTLAGQPYYDLIRQRHLAVFIDHPAYHLPNLDIKSLYVSIACVDLTACRLLTERMGFHRTFFLPHAADKYIEPGTAERDLDVVMLGSLIDYRAQQAEWRERFNPAICRVLDCAVDIALYNKYMALDVAVDTAISVCGVDQSPEERLKNVLAMVPAVDYYLRGRHRAEAVQAVTDADVHVFGSGPWAEYMQDRPNVTLHPPVDLAEGVEVMKRAKIVLNAFPSFPYGGHERIFNGMAAGAAVLTNETPYMIEQFADGVDVLLYDFKNLHGLGDRVNRCLARPDEREEIARRGRARVSLAHTWHHRAKQILEMLA